MYVIIIILLLCNSYGTNGWIHPLKSYCELGCTKGRVNTMCRLADDDCQPKDSKCVPSSISDEYRQIILDVHNHYRNYLASGQEELVGFTVPDMMYIKYDDELAEIAQCHANECVDTGKPNTHDECRRSHRFESVGQNIQHYYLSSLNVERFQEREYASKSMYDGWYMEIKYVDPSNYGENQYTQTVLEGKSVNIGHYAQMIHAKSDHIGCGWATHEREVGSEVKANMKFHYVLVCNYAQGTRLQSTLIKPGEPCSECPEDKPCLKGSKYPALCGIDKDSPDANRGQYIRITNIKYKCLIYLLIILFFL